MPSPAQEAPPESDPAAVLYRTAQILEAEGERELADSLREYILRRYPRSSAAAAILSVRSTTRGRPLDGNGRTELIVGSTLYGLWLGVAIPGMLGADGTEAYGLGLLLGGPAGFGAAWSATRDVHISDGQAGIITWGSTWGTWQGFGWSQIVDPGSECPAGVDPVFCDDEPSPEAMFGWMVAGGLTGLAGGVLAARGLDISAGDATLVNLGSLWGSWYGLALGILADLEDDGLLAATLVGGNAGAGAGALLAHAYPISRSQARLASIIGVVGGLAGAGLDLIVQPESEKVMIAIPAIGSALGLAIGAARIDLGDNGIERRSETGSADWSLGGPLFTMPARGPNGDYRTTLSLTLLNGRF